MSPSNQCQMFVRVMRETTRQFGSSGQPQQCRFLALFSSLKLIFLKTKSSSENLNLFHSYLCINSRAGLQFLLQRTSIFKEWIFLCNLYEVNISSWLLSPLFHYTNFVSEFFNLLFIKKSDFFAFIFDCFLILPFISFQYSSLNDT